MRLVADFKNRRINSVPLGLVQFRIIAAMAAARAPYRQDELVTVAYGDLQDGGPNDAAGALRSIIKRFNNGWVGKRRHLYPTLSRRLGVTISHNCGGYYLEASE